jgi:hypothetical protein
MVAVERQMTVTIKRGIGFSFGILVASLWGLSAQAQITDLQVNALVEALRQAAPQTGKADDGLYSDWQVQPGNIPRWSKACIGRELTPAQFEASPVTARSILACVMKDVLRQEYQASGNRESLAVQRTAAWWMTGKATSYDREPTRAYTQKVLSFYQKQRPSAPTAAKSDAAAYDRFMQQGYQATRQRDYATALTHFQQALQARPGDAYATQALRNVERYLARPQAAPSPTAAAPTTSPIKISDPALAARYLYLTWKAGDRAAALLNADATAVKQLFAQPWASPDLQFQTCTAQGSGFDCTYYSAAAGLRMRVEGNPVNGYRVAAVQWSQN